MLLGSPLRITFACQVTVINEIGLETEEYLSGYRRFDKPLGVTYSPSQVLIHWRMLLFKQNFTRTAIGGLNLAVLLVVSVPLLPHSSEWIGILSNFWFHLIPISIASALAAVFVFGPVRSALLVLVPVGLAITTFGSLGTETSQLSSGEERFKVVTINVLDNNTHNASQIRDFLIGEDADVVFVQEAEGIYAVLDELRAYYPFQTDPYAGCAPASSCDIVLLSRHELLDVRRPETPIGNDRFIVASVDAGGQVLTLAGVHLTKPLNAGQQTREVDVVGPILRDLPRPLIVAGDFNAAPWSSIMRRLLELSGLRLDYGYRPSWPVWLPRLGLPIDHVLISGELGIVSARVHGEAFGSNHFPVVVVVGRRNNT